MEKSHQPSTIGDQTVSICGTNRRYIERRRVGRREYFLLEQIGNLSRQNFSAFDPRSGPGGNFFLVQSFTPSQTTDQYLRAAKRLKVGSFPTIVEWEKHANRIDVVSTWADGVTLSEYLKNIREGRRPPVDPSHAVRLASGLAHGISHLHRRLQIIHGDIQPANIIVTSHPAKLSLIDFGSAWTSDWTTRRTEGDGHHRCYAAPELQSSETSVTSAVDVFSVCVILFELLTLHLPYDGLGGKAGRREYIAEAKRSLVPPSAISKNCQKLPRSLREKVDRLVITGLSFEPEIRYPNQAHWLNQWNELTAEFRLKPEFSPVQKWLTGVIERFMPGRRKSREKND